jgi:hypothetical protein
VIHNVYIVQYVLVAIKSIKKFHLVVIADISEIGVSRSDQLIVQSVVQVTPTTFKR